jgi:hypothetical protein
MSDLTIRHSYADGTLIYGSSKGDGVYELLKALRCGWTYKPSLGQIGLINSRDRAAKQWQINHAADTLRAAGHDVIVEIDDTPARSFAEVEQDSYDRAEDRVDRHTARAERASSDADARWQAERRIRDAYPMGQPILIGHHSEGRHRRDLARADRHAGKGIAAYRLAKTETHRADAAAGYQAGRENVPTTLRRIERLAATERKMVREGAPPQRLADIRAELEYWRAHVEAARAAGVKVWGRTDFQRGDFVRHGSRWFEVIRVNAKSVTVPPVISDGPVITAAGSRYSWTDKLPYDKVTGRMSAQDMAAKLTAKPKED